MAKQPTHLTQLHNGLLQGKPLTFHTYLQLHPVMALFRNGPIFSKANH
jgi:hypothetical protein